MEFHFTSTHITSLTPLHCTFRRFSSHYFITATIIIIIIIISQAMSQCYGISLHNTSHHFHARIDDFSKHIFVIIIIRRRRRIRIRIRKE